MAWSGDDVTLFTPAFYFSRGAPNAIGSHDLYLVSCRACLGNKRVHILSPLLGPTYWYGTDITNIFFSKKMYSGGGCAPSEENL